MKQPPEQDELGISLKYEHSGDIFAEIDIERIEQVLVNLIDNAIKFSEPSTQVIVAVSESEESILLTVKDQGVGIAEENLEVVFDKFQTIPSEKKRENKGCRLGACNLQRNC